MAMTGIIPGPLTGGWGGDSNPLLAWQRDMTRLFAAATRSFALAVLRPAAWRSAWAEVEVTEPKTEVRVAARLQGLEAKEIAATRQDGLLTRQGEISAQTDRALQSARWHGRFRRPIPVGPQVDPELLRAMFRGVFCGGVPGVTLAKWPGAQAAVRRIAISSNRPPCAPRRP